MKNLPGMDLEASPAPSEVIHQTREVHKIDLGLGGYNKGWFLFILVMFKVLCATVWLWQPLQPLSFTSGAVVWHDYSSNNT